MLTIALVVMIVAFAGAVWAAGLDFILDHPYAPTGVMAAMCILWTGVCIAAGSGIVMVVG